MSLQDKPRIADGSLADIKAALAERTRELEEAQQHQTATSEILASISGSPTDAKPVFDAIVRNLLRLFGTSFASVQLLRGGTIELPAADGAPGIERITETYPRPLDDATVGGQAMLTKQVVQYSPVVGNRRVPKAAQQIARDCGYNSIIAAPMICQGKVIGAIACAHREPRVFTDKEVALIKAFADQAVIAIENVRLFEAEQQRSAELTESLQQQTATADVLKVISRSTFDLQAVFDTLVESVARLCQADASVIWRLRPDGRYHLAAGFGVDDEFKKHLNSLALKPDGRSVVGRSLQTGKTTYVPDVMAEPEYTERDAKDFGGYRGLLCVPLLREGAAIGVLMVAHKDARHFSDTQIALATTFANQAVIAIENVRLFEAEQDRTRELTEALEYQTATSEVLNVISRSPTNVQPVFDMIAERAQRLCEGQYCFVYRFDGELLHFVAHSGLTPDVLKMNQSAYPAPPGRKSAAARAVLERKVVQIPDVKADAEFALGPMASAGGFGSVVGVPILRDGVPVGSIAVTRVQTGLLPERQIELLETFADQAVIAIENTRLFEAEQQRTKELSETLEQQTATSEILRVIAASPTNIQPVLDSVAESAARLCDAYDTVVLLRDGEVLKLGAHYGPIQYDFDTWPIGRGWVTGRCVIECKTQHVEDLAAAGAEYPEGHAMAVRFGHRTTLATPLLRKGEAIGALMIRRDEVRPFSEEQIELLRTFADQAAIAIENVRLFEAEQQRTDELAGALERQTATSEVLEVISRSAFDLQPVFQTVADSAVKLCGADRAFIFRFDGELLRMVVARNAPAELEAFIRDEPIRPGRGSGAGRAALERRTVHIADVTVDPEYTFKSKDVAPLRTVLTVPILKGSDLLGVILTYRLEVKPFSAKQIELVETFAGQAAIAIENARLFAAEQQRTRELSESLEQQTATSEVLEVISTSPGELEPVFAAMLENAVRICEAKFGNLFLYDGDAFRTAALYGAPPAWAEARRQNPVIHPSPGSGLARLTQTKQVVHIADIKAEPAYISGDPVRVALADLAGARTYLSVPMLKEDELVGAITIYRQEVRPFTDKQIALVTNFASQAVIAIENTRLLNELRETLERQTATSEVLKVIARSPGDLEPVFETILSNAVRICDAKLGTLFLSEGDDKYRTAALYGAPPEFAEARRRNPVLKAAPGTGLGRVAATKQAAQILDAREEPAYANDPTRSSFINLAGARTVINVPMLKDNELVGQIGIYRQEVRPFTEKQIELLANFAAQAVIAIENARLLSELRQRTDDLTESLEQQTATSEVLRVISTSPGELEPVFRTMLENATQLCGAKFGTLNLYDGEKFKTAALHNPPPGFQERIGEAWRPHPKSGLARIAATKQVVHIDDLRTQPPYLEGNPAVVGLSDVAGARTVLLVPMLKDDELIGNISIYRQEVRPFSEKQIALLSNFAAQAVIAIENTRLLSELRQRTDDLTESLEQQTATSEVLRVISSSPGELEPVFQAMLGNATRICEASFGSMLLAEGDALRRVALHNAPQRFVEFHNESPLVQPQKVLAIKRLVETKQFVHVFDMAIDDPDDPINKYAGARTLLIVPMLKDNDFVGAIAIYRQEVRPFTDKQIELVTNFAAQAVIAIENTRLLSELRETLERQTATSEVLKVISRSPGELEPVFQAMLQNATRICAAKIGILWGFDDGAYRAVSMLGITPVYAEYLNRGPIHVGPATGLGRLASTKQTVHIVDTLDEQAYADRDPFRIATAELGGARTLSTCRCSRKES